jgi:hypothetical protein
MAITYNESNRERISWLLRIYWTTGVNGSDRRVKSPLDISVDELLNPNLPPFLNFTIAIKINELPIDSNDKYFHDLLAKI